MCVSKKNDIFLYIVFILYVTYNYVMIRKYNYVIAQHY